MNNIINLSSDNVIYKDSSLFGRIKDRLKVKYEGEYFIKDINISIKKVRIPANVDIKSYYRNVNIAKRFGNSSEVEMSPNIWSIIDYDIFNEYQKKLFAYSIVRSIKLSLRVRNKNINNSCILIYDAKDKINRYIIYELAKVARYIILLSDNLKLLKNIREYVMANYGVTPIITRDNVYALKEAEFIITSKNIEPKYKSSIWYLNNKFIPKNTQNLQINNVIYKTPWEIEGVEKNIQLIGAILSQIGHNKRVEEDLKCNGIYIEKFNFIV
ncbi:hypothetical protein ACFIJ5_01610 [Haloimpatiens sp. FM7330]|uniref:hypothetical protein n=1 Tax=Haloimpatiens sp. FM7330 TaxID=3298610 RepID=UPI003632B61F